MENQGSSAALHGRELYSYEKRLEGFNRACDEAGIPREDRHTYIHFDPTREDAPVLSWHASMTNRLLRWREEGVDGLFVFCDEEAWHVQSVLQQTPLLQDWDVGIVSFDNIQGVQHFPADLCSVECNFAEMARQAIDLLRDRIHGDDRPPQSVVCPVRLVCRGRGLITAPSARPARRASSEAGGSSPGRRGPPAA